jgi:FkbM family methyltransferase
VGVFGVGAISFPIVAAIREFTGIRINFLCDNDPAKWGRMHHGDLRCLPPDDIDDYADKDTAIIITAQAYQAICAQLRRKGFRKIYVLTDYRLRFRDALSGEGNIRHISAQVARTMDLLHDDRSREILGVIVKNWFDFDIAGAGYGPVCTGEQYFPPDIVRLRDDEVFADVGAYIGDTLLEFVDRSRGRFKSIHAFEIDKRNFGRLQDAVSGLDAGVRTRIVLHNCGAYDREQEMRYETGVHGSQSTCVNVCTSAGETGRMVRLSDELRGVAVTFIKMDIEGAEPEALRGAAELIEERRPTLAIAVYHRPDHLWEIPQFIKSLVPEYRLYLRHHTLLEYETVCYAVCPEPAAAKAPRGSA